MNIDDVLIEAINVGASDIHVVCVLPPIFRVHGRLVKLDKFGDITPELSEKVLTKILNEEQLKRLREKLSVDFSYSLPGHGRFRCNYYYQRNTLAAAFRYISREIPSIDELGLPPQVGEFAKYPRGLVLVTGPTGCGKSTTLASIIEMINGEDEISYNNVKIKNIYSSTKKA